MSDGARDLIVYYLQGLSGLFGVALHNVVCPYKEDYGIATPVSVLINLQKRFHNHQNNLCTFGYVLYSASGPFWSMNNSSYYFVVLSVHIVVFFLLTIFHMAYSIFLYLYSHGIWIILKMVMSSLAEIVISFFFLI